MNRYATRDEAIQREIIDAIEAGEATAAEFDIDAIAAEVLGDYSEGYAQQVDADEFWQIVARHAFLARYSAEMVDPGDGTVEIEVHTEASGRLSWDTPTGFYDRVFINVNDLTDPQSAEEWHQAVDAALRQAGWERGFVWEDSKASTFTTAPVRRVGVTDVEHEDS